MTPQELQQFRARVVAKMQFASAQAIAESANVHVCATECHIPGSAQGQCAQCGCPVWYADLKDAPLRKICLPCACKMPEFKTADYVALRNSVWDGYPEN